MSKNFINPNIPLIQRIETPEGRRYQTPEGKLYPSATGITSLLAEVEGTDYIKEWREKVGEKVADDISRRAAERGTLVHEAAESYLKKGKFPEFDMFQQTEKRMCTQLLPVLDKIDNIRCVETPLWTDRFELAGTVDLIAEYENELMVIDWKTSSSFKHRNDINGYFLQTAIYAFMFWERTGIPIKNSLIVLTTPDDGLMVYVEPINKHLQKLPGLRKLHREKFGV